MTSENVKISGKMHIPSAERSFGKQRKINRFALLFLILIFTSACENIREQALLSSMYPDETTKQGPTAIVKNFALLHDVPHNVYICVDSNVTANIYVDGKRVGPTPFCGNLGRGQIALKARERKSAKVPVKKRRHKESFKLLKKGGADLLPDYTTANATSSSMPASTDMTALSQGRWYEYAPYSYFVELTLSTGQSDVYDKRIREFALKNFYEIKAGKPEYEDTLAALTGLEPEKIRKIIKFHTTPETFARKISFIKTAKNGKDK